MRSRCEHRSVPGKGRYGGDGLRLLHGLVRDSTEIDTPLRRFPPRGVQSVSQRRELVHAGELVPSTAAPDACSTRVLLEAPLTGEHPPTTSWRSVRIRRASRAAAGSLRGSRPGAAHRRPARKAYPRAGRRVHASAGMSTRRVGRNEAVGRDVVAAGSTC